MTFELHNFGSTKTWNVKLDDCQKKYLHIFSYIHMTFELQNFKINWNMKNLDDSLQTPGFEPNTTCALHFLKL